MLIINNSTPKSASSLLRHYVIKMIKKVNYNGQAELGKMISIGKICGVGTYIETKEINRNLIRYLIDLSLDKGPILIKVHLLYSKEYESLLYHENIFMTYNYRDPRDMILSAIDHRIRAEKAGKKEFGIFTTVEESIPPVIRWSQSAINWKNSHTTYDLSYDYFLNNKEKILSEINNRLQFSLSEETLKNILIEEEAMRRPGLNQFNIGKPSFRYKSEMTKGELKLSNEKLKKFIIALAYDY